MTKTLLLALGLLIAVGCAQKPQNGAGNFQISGKLAPGGTGSSALSANVQGITASGRTVTHVMAVNPSSSNPARVISPIGSDGSFKLGVDGSRPWVLVFIDNTKTGRNMIVGVFQASQLHTLTPNLSQGSADLGNMSMDGGTANMGIPYDQLLSQLGLTQDDANYIGRIDGLCLRYVNPDIDNNGVIDALESNRNFMLDFHVQNQASVNGHQATIADLIGSFLDPVSTQMTYGGTGIYLSYPTSFDGADPSGGSVTFTSPAYYWQMQNGPQAVVMTPAGTPITGAGLSVNNFSGYKGFGIYAEGAGGHDMPQGDYVFAIDGKTLTFTNVATRSDANLTAGTDLMMPFIRFNLTNPSCASNCTIASLDYQWMVKTSTGWVQATAAQVNLTMNDLGGYISIRPHLDNNTSQNIGIVIPKSPPSGNLAWAAAGNQLANITEADMKALHTTDICHLGLSYDDKIGMRMFSGIQNAPGTCQ